MVKLTQLLKEDLIKRKQRLLKEEISRDEVVTDIESVQTIVDGRRGVAYIAEIGTPSEDWKAIQDMIRDNHLKAMHVKGNENNAFVVYAQGHEKDAMELKGIAEKYGGYLAWNATKEDSRRIGELLNYKKSEIDDYIAQNYPDDIDEALDVSWNPFEEQQYKFKVGDKVYEDGSENPAKVIEVQPNFEAASKTKHLTKPVNWENEDEPYYFVHNYGGMGNYMWYPEEALSKEPSGWEIDEALDVSWNPYEETDDLWWYEEEGDGINWDAVMDTIKAAANKIVGNTAPNRNSYFNVWYDVIKSYADEAWENWEWGDKDEDTDDDGVMNACRDEVKYYISPQDWENTKDALVYKMEEYSNIVADKKTLANLQKMGVLIHKMLSSKHKPSLSEALDVSWNPYEAWKDKYTENSWLRLKIGSRGEFEDAEIEEIPNIEKYLLDRKKSAYKELLKDLKDSGVDEEDREGEICYFNDFVGPFKMDKENSDHWGYGIGEEDYHEYYRLLSDKYEQWVANMVNIYGNNFTDQISGSDVDELNSL